jgi:pectate lyase
LGVNPEGGCSTPIPSAGEWHHIVATYDGSAKKWYLDGQPKTAVPASGTISFDTGALYIGNKGVDEHFDGAIDNVMIFDRGLLAEEVQQLYADGLGGKAYCPNPEDGAEYVDPDIDLSWSPTQNVISHDVYLGTDFNDVNDSNTPLVIRDVNNYDPGTLELETTYYWRVDEDCNALTYKGDVWSFTTRGVKACQPNPEDGAEFLPVDTVLSWLPGYGAIEHDVYFGTDFNDVNEAVVPDSNTDVNSFDPCGLEFLTTYYWRIDEDDGSTVHKGDVWSFTTQIEIGTTPAFPEAEGAGKWSVGGRRGEVYEVNTVADYNDSEPLIAGSLRAAVEAEGRRIVVFRISGTIHLKTKLIITNPHITIAGQSAPGDGICVARHPVVVEADHVVIRHVRFRLSDEGVNDPGYTGPEGYDSLSVNKGKNIMLDHCSASWSIDESLSTSVQDRNSDVLGKLTVQWCMIAESLNCSAHISPECHGYGTLAKGGWGNEYTYHHNLYAHHVNRNPYPGNYNHISVDPEGLTFDFRNNVIYNWGLTSAGYNTQSGADSVTKMNFVGNYYKQGPESDDAFAFSQGFLPTHGVLLYLMVGRRPK